MLNNQTCLENLNAAMVDLARKDEKVIFIGEDIKAPYNGAYKVEKGLYELCPDRVISTPISEESFTGLASGLSMCGYKPIVDFMFSDFMTLGFDMILNFCSKYPDMYGRELKFPMIIRSANGGYRGYGATHSQSMQKYFMGIPNAFIYEMSPYHDNTKVFNRMFDKNKLCIFFEEKSVYNQKMYKLDNTGIFKLDYIGENDNWAYISTQSCKADVAIITTGGLSNTAINSALELLTDYEIEAEIFIPSQLYPVEISQIIDKLIKISNVVIIEEGTYGANWGSEILAELQKLMNGKNLIEKINLLSSDAKIIPANTKLENQVLINKEKIVNLILSL